MKSFYIGPSGGRLYCNLHSPSPGLVREARILLCPPLGHEYYRSYRAYVRLAEHLAECGFTVLRFDYQGTGDSEGESGPASLLACAGDAARAAAVLRDGDNESPIVLVGMRFGSIVAAMAAPMIDATRAVVLWEPVIDGAGYIDELRWLHRRALDDLERFPRHRDSGEYHDTEFLGHVYGDGLVEALNGFDIEGPDMHHRCVMVMSAVAPAASRSDHVQLPLKRLPHAGYGWTDPRRVSETIVDPVANREFARILDEVCA